MIKGPLYHSARKVHKQHSLNLNQSINFGKGGLPGIQTERKTSSSLKKVIPPFQEVESPNSTISPPPLSARPMTQAFPKRQIPSQYAMKISVNSTSLIDGPYVAGKVSIPSSGHY